MVRVYARRIYKMPDIDDQLTRQQAHIIAKDYNFVPQDPLKCERVIHETDLQSIFFANTSNRVKCYIQYRRDAKTVTGVQVPNVSGVFLMIELHNDELYFQRHDEAWFIWWDGVDTWNISEVLGVQGDSFWTRTDPTVDGDYVPQGTAQGTPTVEPSNF